MALPITITLYDHATHEVLAQFSRGRVPWKLFKDAVHLARRIDAAQAMDETAHQETAALLTALAGYQFTIEQVLLGMSQHEMVTALRQIVRRAASLGQQASGNEAAPPAGEQDGSPDWVVGLESMLVRALGWSLHDIDETDVESLLPFVAALTAPAPEKTNLAYCDQVSWL